MSLGVRWSLYAFPYGAGPVVTYCLPLNDALCSHHSLARGRGGLLALAACMLCALPAQDRRCSLLRMPPTYGARLQGLAQFNEPFPHETSWGVVASMGLLRPSGRQRGHMASMMPTHYSRCYTSQIRLDYGLRQHGLSTAMRTWGLPTTTTIPIPEQCQQREPENCQVAAICVVRMTHCCGCTASCPAPAGFTHATHSPHTAMTRVRICPNNCGPRCHAHLPATTYIGGNWFTM